jgi:hypothetical protein
MEIDFLYPAGDVIQELDSKKRKIRSLFLIRLKVRKENCLVFKLIKNNYMVGNLLCLKKKGILHIILYLYVINLS